MHMFHEIDSPIGFMLDYIQNRGKGRLTMSDFLYLRERWLTYVLDRLCPSPDDVFPSLTQVSGFDRFLVDEVRYFANYAERIMGINVAGRTSSIIQ